MCGFCNLQHWTWLVLTHGPMLAGPARRKLGSLLWKEMTAPSSSSPMHVKTKTGSKSPEVSTDATREPRAENRECTRRLLIAGAGASMSGIASAPACLLSRLGQPPRPHSPSIEKSPCRSPGRCRCQARAGRFTCLSTTPEVRRSLRF